jgi:vancomycin resistance protein VanW
MKKRNDAYLKILTAVLIILIFLLSVGMHALPLKSGESRACTQETATLGSGPETELPWAEEKAFLDKVEETGSKVLLGAYRTVLKDPLPGEEYNVHLAASMLAGRTVKPGEVFSQNGSIGPYTSDKGFQRGPTYVGTTLTTTIGGGVCKIASTLYNVAVLSNLEIVERHAHSMPVPYVPYGQDATVAYGARDFKFRNNTSSTLLIWAQGIDNVLYIAFYGASPSPMIVWEHEVLETRKAPKNYKINPLLEGDSQKVLLEGMDGAVVKSWVHITDSEGDTRIKYMGVSDYRPMPYIIEKAR